MVDENCIIGGIRRPLCVVGTGQSGLEKWTVWGVAEQTDLSGNVHLVVWPNGTRRYLFDWNELV